jgi:PST family polysaccharide transporter
MSLIRTSAWNGMAVAIRMVSALVLNKILAVYVGPTGYAIIGQFQNAVTMAIAFATGAVNNGVVKLTAELDGDEAGQHSLWRTAGMIVVGTSLLSSLLIVVFRAPLTHFFLKDSASDTVFLWLALSLTLISFNALLLAILNGKKEVRRYIVSNIAGSLIGFAIVALLAWRFGLQGALVALSVNQALMFFVTLQQTVAARWFRLGYLFGRIDPAHALALGKFVLMAIATAVVGPISQVLVRNHLGITFGWEYAGYWDGSWRISALYLTLVTTTLSLYYLPRIAEINGWPEMKAEILSVYRLIVPLVIAGALAIFIGRDLLIGLLFTSNFLPMRDLLGWQLAGDVVKIASWLLAFLMVGKGLVRAFILTEIMSGLLFWLLAILFTRLYGFPGVAIAHLVNYSIYFVVVYAATISTESRRSALFGPPKT